MRKSNFVAARASLQKELFRIRKIKSQICWRFHFSGLNIFLPTIGDSLFPSQYSNCRSLRKMFVTTSFVGLTREASNVALKTSKVRLIFASRRTLGVTSQPKKPSFFASGHFFTHERFYLGS
jgi:hypothetical protein